MTITLILIFTAIALFLIFRDDHDRSYSDEGYAKDPKKRDPGKQPFSAPGSREAARTTSRPEPGPSPREVPEPSATPVPESIPTFFLETLDYDEDLDENSEMFSVTGLRYYCTDEDLGLIFGTVRPEPTNVHDYRAQAVKLHDGRTIGYIPRSELDDYEDFNEDDVDCPFIGELYKDERGSFQAEILVVIPASQEYVQEEFEDYFTS